MVKNLVPLKSQPQQQTSPGSNKMSIYIKYLLLLLVTAFVLSCTETSKDKPAPQITSQGFEIQELQQGDAGNFGNLKLRVESAGRVKQLYIKERSYEVDLATTPDTSNFALFGIDKKTMLRTDVTIDFQNYINKKLNQPGTYEFEVIVVDKEEKTANTKIKINVIKPAGETTPVETGAFRLQRSGKNLVTGSDPFGITWKTIDKNRVTVSVAKKAGGAEKLVKLDSADYQKLKSKEALGLKINAAEAQETINFDTANNAAAEQVFGVAIRGKYYLLKTSKSNTNLSDVGTTVTLNGEYKY